MTDTVINIENVWIAAPEADPIENVLVDQEEFERLFDRNAELDAENGVLAERVLELEGLLQQERQEASDLAAENDRLRRRRSAAEQRILVLEKQNDELRDVNETTLNTMSEALHEVTRLEKELEEAKQYAARNYEHSYAVDNDGNPKLGSIWLLATGARPHESFVYVGHGKYLTAWWKAWGGDVLNHPLWEWFIDEDRIPELIPHPDHYGPDAKQAQ